MDRFDRWFFFVLIPAYLLTTITLCVLLYCKMARSEPDAATKDSRAPLATRSADAFTKRAFPDIPLAVPSRA
jgi:hypothetical protein